MINNVYILNVYKNIFSERERDLCSPLLNITSIPNVSFCQNREQGVTDFLQNILPSSDCKHIPDELRKVSR